ncbi:MAG: hypothetical protein JEZ09_04920, partial [Salinivirgaceae bacterium]|nr:hypothetical protein [Salinivirgaceae bacterium]
MRKLLLLLTTFVALIHVNAQESRYWVSGSGNWNDQTHWALESGGSGGASVPTENTDVYVDNNSLNNGGYIAINESAKCNNFYADVKDFALKGKKTFYIAGSFEINDKASLKKFKGDMVFTSSNKSTINIPVALKSNIIFEGTGSWDLNSEIKTKQGIYLEKGFVNTQSHNIECYTFEATSSNAKGLTLGSSEIGTQSWIIENSNTMDFDAGTSYIYIPDRQKNFKSGDLKYNLLGASSIKAISSITPTITDALCYPGTDSGDGSREEGNLNVVVAPAGNYYIVIWNTLTDEEADKAFGNNIDFALTSGTYDIIVRETGWTGGYTNTGASNIVGSPDELQTEIVVNTHISCPDASDLSLTHNTIGGTFPLDSMRWANQSLNYSFLGPTTDPNLGYNNYFVKVYDNNGCVATDNFYFYPYGNSLNEYDENTLPAPGRPLEITIDDAIPTGTCETDLTGEIEITGVSNGTPNFIAYTTGYGYAAIKDGDPDPSGPGDFQDGNTITDLAAGDYNVWVIDGNGCMQEYGSNPVNVESIPAPSSEIMYDSEVCEGIDFTVAAGQAVASNYPPGGIAWNIVPGKGNGSLSNANTLTPTYIQDAIDAGTIVELRMVVTGNGTCTPVSDTLYLTINENPKPNAGADASVCANSYFIFDAGTSPLSGTVFWTQLDGLADGTITFTPNASTVKPVANLGGSNPTRFRKYQLQVEETKNGCSDTDTIEVTFIQPPGSNIVPSSTTICEGDTYDLDGAEATAAVSILWTNTTNPGDQSGFNSRIIENPVYTPTATDLAMGSPRKVTLKMEVTGDLLCAGTATSTIDLTIGIVPDADAGLDASFCGPAATLSGVQSEVGSSANWVKISGPVGGTVSINNSSAFVTNVTLTGTTKIYGTYGFKLTETLGTCSDIDNVLITFNKQASGYAGDDAAICEGESFEVTTATANNAGSILWTKNGLGNFTAGTQTTITPTYNSVLGDNNPVTLTMTLSGTGACAAAIYDFVDDMSLTINELPDPSITGDNDVCINDVETYFTEPGMSNYDWTVSNGTITSGGDGNETIDVQWTGAAGVLTVAYTDGNSCSGTSANFNVTINARPTPTLPIEVTSACVGSTGNRYETQAGQSNYIWIVSAGGTKNLGGEVTDNFIEITWNTAGPQTVSVNYDNAAGCNGASPAVSNVTVNPSATPTFIQEVTSACVGSIGNRYETQSLKSNYIWTVSAGGTKTLGGTGIDNFVEVTWNTAGAQTVSVNYDNAGGCPAASPTVSNVTVNPNPTPTILTGENEVCFNDIETYTTEPGKSNYFWVATGGTLSSPNGLASIDVQWTGAAGVLTVLYSDGNSCSGTSANFNVTINALPIITFVDQQTDVCVGSTLNNYSTQALQSNYVWIVSAGGTITDGGTATDDFVEVTWNTAGPQTVSVNYDNAAGCSAEDAAVSNVTVNPSPLPYAGDDASICYIDDYQIVGASVTGLLGGDYSEWSSNGDGTFDDKFALNPIYTPGSSDQTNGTVTLTLTAKSTLCGDVADDMILSIYPEMLASVGGVSPYLIDVTSTVINVSIWAEHPDITQLSFYLVNPDGDKEIKLYDFVENDGPDGCNAWDISTDGTIDSLVFSLNSPGGTLGAFNLCDFSGGSVTGEYDPEDSWNIIDGEDPAAGGWALRIVDNFGGSQGQLTRGRITFKDIDAGTGLARTISYDSKDIAYDINDNSTTTYIVPIGLRTSCNGSCDANAIVSVQNGSGNYTYDWGNPLIPNVDNVLLCGGDHTVTVTDIDRGCTSVATVSVLEPDPILTSMDSLNVLCYGDSSGMVTVKATQGVLPYEFVWNDGNATENDTVFNLPAGEYIVTVTDFNLCTTIDTVEVGQPLAPISVLDITIDSTDCDAPNGSITITPQGGTVAADYTYLLDGVPTVHPFINLGVGTYDVSILDDVSCSLDTTITMVDKGDLEIVDFTMNSEVTCNSACDGEVQVNVIGGTNVYFYSWADASGEIGTDQFLPNVCGDSTYNVIITDVNSCSVSGDVLIQQPDSLLLDVLSQSDVLCFGDSTGIAEVIGTGGTGAYSYVWYTATNDTLSLMETANNLPFGTIYIDVRDANCLHTDSIDIGQPANPITATTDSTPADCSFANGTATVTPTGGTPYTVGEPYRYLWDDLAASTTATAVGLESGIYNVTISDSNSCQLVKTVTVLDNSTLVVTADSSENVLCAGDKNGKAFITVTGGTPDYIFDWTGGETTEDAQFLTAGTNYVTVTDAAGCKQIVQFDITQPDSLKSFTTIISEPTCPGAFTDTVSVTPSDGTPFAGANPYTYEWDNGQTDSIATGLGAGMHYVTIWDKNACSHVDSVFLTDPDSITFEFEFTKTDCGTSTGTINVANIKGGTDDGIYSTSWASPEWEGLYPAPDSIGTDTIRNLWVGNYVAIVSDANGCQLRDSMNLTDNSNMDIVRDSIAMVSCFGGDNGYISVHGIGATAPYSYEWSNADADSILNDVQAGIYSLIVLDKNLCRRDTAFEITQPTQISNEFIYTDAIICAGKDTASLYASASGGTGNHYYTWVNADDEIMSEDSTLYNVGTGWYYLTVYDDKNCLFEDSIEIIEPEVLVLSLIDQGLTNCADSTGYAEVTAVGGIQFSGVNKYIYHWYLLSDPDQILPGNDLARIENLWVDVFAVRVTDSLGCFTEDTVIIEADTDLDFAINIDILPTCPTINNGKAHVFGVISGTAPFTYEWGNGESIDTAYALPAGIT